MFDNLGSEYADWLKANNLLDGVLSRVHNASSKAFSGIKSLMHTEMQLDIMEQMFMSNREQRRMVNREGENSYLANQLVSVPASDKIAEFIAWNCHGQIQRFQINEDFGQESGQPLAGILTERPCHHDPLNNSIDDQIFVCEAQRLRDLSAETIRMLQNAKVVITNTNVDLFQVAQKLEQIVLRTPEQYTLKLVDEGGTEFTKVLEWKQCFAHRFIVVKDMSQFQSLKQITRPSSKSLENQDGSKVADLNEFINVMKEVIMKCQSIPLKFWDTGSKTELKRAFIKSTSAGETNFQKVV